MVTQPTNSFDHYISKYIFDPERVLTTILNVPDKSWNNHTWYNNSTNTHDTKTGCHSSTFAPGKDEYLSTHIFTLISQFCQQYCNTHLFAHITNSSIAKYNKYTVGCSMDNHVDLIHSIFDGQTKGVPILSAVLLLNDNFEGGQFYLNGVDMELKAGECLIFPSTFMYPHEVKEVTSGVRFSAVSWMW
jgi:hypothetical protein